MTALRAGIWTCLDPGGTSRIGPGNPGWELARESVETHRPGSRGAEITAVGGYLPAPNGRIGF